MPMLSMLYFGETWMKVKILCSKDLVGLGFQYCQIDFLSKFAEMNIPSSIGKTQMYFERPREVTDFKTVLDLHEPYGISQLMWLSAAKLPSQLSYETQAVVCPQPKMQKQHESVK